MNAREAAVMWAQGLLRKEFRVLDVGTKNAGFKAKLREISVINSRKEILFADKFHPDFFSAGVYPELLRDPSPIVIFNAPFDLRVIRNSLPPQTLHSFDLPKKVMIHCAMQYASDYIGHLDANGKIRWQHLSYCKRYFNIPSPTIRKGLPPSLKDCLVTLDLIIALAGGN
jgi:hypothetical protein